MTRDRSGGALETGLAAGGRGGPEDELLDAGQEEVFSRTEVGSGRIEHKSDAGGGQSPLPGEQIATPPVGSREENPMTDANPIPPQPDEPNDADRSAGVNRPDQNNTDAPGKTRADPATGGEGAAGAGGSGGFGT
jgi:hypothetical protein